MGKSFVTILFSAGLLLAATVSKATIIYDLNFDIGPHTVTGFIETDGTFGALSGAEISDFSFDNVDFLGGPLTPATATLFSPTLQFVANPFRASPTTIAFNYENPGFIQLVTADGSSLICITGTIASDCIGNTREAIIGFFGAPDPDIVILTDQFGPLLLGTVATIPTPVPAAFPLPLFLGALAGIGGLGFMRRRKKAQTEV